MSSQGWNESTSLCGIYRELFLLWNLQFFTKLEFQCRCLLISFSGLTLTCFSASFKWWISTSSAQSLIAKFPFRIFFLIIVMFASFTATRMSSPVKFSALSANSSMSSARQHCACGRRVLMRFWRSLTVGTSMWIFLSKRRRNAESISLKEGG